MEGDGVTRWISGWVGVVGGGVWCEARGMRGRGGGARQGGEGGLFVRWEGAFTLRCD
jgi:hypothetical protein